MSAGPSVMSLIASGFYCCVVMACVAAALTAQRFRQAPGHWRTWVLLALLFGGLAVLRLIDFEDWFRGALREQLRAGAGYGERRSFQAPLVAAMLAIAGAGAFALLYRVTRHLRGRRNIARLVGNFAAFGMIFLLCLRLASLHAIDALLFGPLKLNWVLDMGASLAVLLAAGYYVRIVRARP